MNKKLTPATKKRLVDLEVIIENSLEKEFESRLLAGQALQEIRDQQLYLSSHDSWETYTKERWSYDQSYATRLIKSSNLFDQIKGAGHALPENIRQLRALVDADIEPEEAVKAWGEIVESGTPITGKSVAEFVEGKTKDSAAPIEVESTVTSSLPVAPVKPETGEDEIKIPLNQRPASNLETEAIKKLRGVVSDGLIQHILSGQILISLSDLDKWAALSESDAFAVGHYVGTMRWSYAKAVKAVQDTLDTKDRVATLINRCLATEQKKIRFRFDKFVVDVYRAE